jgi:hypothetical protein
VALLFLLKTPRGFKMAITSEQKALLNRYAGHVQNKVQLGTLIDNIQPTHVVKAAGTHTTAGGDASESITAAAVVSTDIVVVTVKTAGATPRSVVAAAAGTGSIAVTMSGDPSTDHVLQYVVYRAAP